MKLLAGAHALLAWCASASAQGDDFRHDVQVRDLLAPSAARDAREVAAGLAGLGPIAAGACVRAVIEGLVPPELRETLYASLCRHPEAWRFEVAALAGTALDVRARVELLELLEALGAARDLELVRSVATCPAAGAPSRELEHALQRTLAAILASDGAAWQRWWTALEQWPQALRPALLTAAAESRDPRGLALLAEHLELRKGQRLLTLRLIARCAAQLPWPPHEPALLAVRARLGDEHPAVRREGALAAAQLQDEDSVPLLIGLLKAGDPGVAPQAGWALRRITGVPLRDEPERWEAWLESESDWWRHVAPRLLEELESPDRRRAVQALHQIAGRRYPRHALAMELGAALHEADDELGRLLAAAIGQLGSPAGIPALQARLAADHGALRPALLQALGALQGHFPAATGIREGL